MRDIIGRTKLVPDFDITSFLEGNLFKMCKYRLLIGFTALTFLTTHQAQATLIGDTVNAAQILNGVIESGVPISATVDTVLTEYTPQFGLPFTIDIDAGSITVENGVNSFSLGTHILQISDLDWVGMPLGRITGISVQAVDIFDALSPTVSIPYDISRVTFSDHFVEIDIAGTTWGNRNFLGFSTSTGVLTINLQTSHIPEPITATLGLMGLGVLGLTSSRRSRTA